MCTSKPGPRCAADTEASVGTTAITYRSSHPEGPDVGTLAAAKTEVVAPTPSDPRELVTHLKSTHPGLALDLHKSSTGYVTLSRIVVPPEERASGKGTSVMTEIVAAADRNGWPLALTPSSDFGGSRARLEGFYRRFGFVPNKGANKDYATKETFIRMPHIV